VPTERALAHAVLLSGSAQRHPSSKVGLNALEVCVPSDCATAAAVRRRANRHRCTPSGRLKLSRGTAGVSRATGSAVSSRATGVPQEARDGRLFPGSSPGLPSVQPSRESVTHGDTGLPRSARA
jgi:hypothetical protein